jgi:hypothetical protein
LSKGGWLNQNEEKNTEAEEKIRCELRSSLLQAGGFWANGATRKAACNHQAFEGCFTRTLELMS